MCLSVVLSSVTTASTDTHTQNMGHWVTGHGDTCLQIHRSAGKGRGSNEDLRPASYGDRPCLSKTTRKVWVANNLEENNQQEENEALHLNSILGS